MFERLVATAASSATLSGLTTTDSVARARFLGMSLEAVGEGGSRTLQERAVQEAKVWAILTKVIADIRG